MGQFRIAVCVYTTNAAETIRATEIAKAVVDVHGRRGGCEELILRFFTYRGSLPGHPPREVDYEDLVQDAGFDVEYFGSDDDQPILDDDMWQVFLRAERNHEGLFPPPYEDRAAPFIRAIMQTVGEFRPDLLLHGLFPEVAVASTIRGWTNVSFATVPISSLREWVKKSGRSNIQERLGMQAAANEGPKKQRRDPWKVMREAAVECGLELPAASSDGAGAINALFLEAIRPNRTIVCDFPSFYEGTKLPSDVSVVGPIISSDTHKTKDVDDIEAFLQNEYSGDAPPIKVLLTMGSTGEPHAFAEGLKALCSAEMGTFRSVAIVPKAMQQSSEVKSILESARSMQHIFIAEKFVPVRPLTQLVNVLLSHGGQLTIQCALSAGVPIVGHPVDAEQLYNLENVERSGGCGGGAGVCLSGVDWTAENIREALLRVGGRASPCKNGAAKIQAELLNGGSGLDRAGTIIWEMYNRH
ncbi:hypothetical protein ACHAXT_012735 [Thalassiosira profunda]